MNEPVTFTVMGVPVGKARAFIGRNGNFTPHKTHAYEQQAKTEAKIAMMGREPITGPASITIRAELPIPKSWSKRKQQAALVGEIKPQNSTDIDNYAKSAMDACNKIVFVDDHQVTRLTAEKVYSEQPKMIVTVKPD